LRTPGKGIGRQTISGSGTVTMGDDGEAAEGLGDDKGVGEAVVVEGIALAEGRMALELLEVHEASTNPTARRIRMVMKGRTPAAYELAAGMGAPRGAS
jgi:hypothetical protein